MADAARKAGVTRLIDMVMLGSISRRAHAADAGELPVGADI